VHESTSAPGAAPEIPHSAEFLDDHLPVEYFRQDVVRLVHQLRIPGWSHVTLDMASDLDMGRIDCALTNSVYYVKAPPYIKEMLRRENPHLRPVNLLLRVYGPNVDMLIDREKELKTVAELTKHNIGPRLFGTFQNGRFEQFLNAKGLTRHDMRQPETSIQIAKRMSDLHQNVPLSAEDLALGPVIWQYLDKWIPAAREQLRKIETKMPGTTNRVVQRDSFEELVRAISRYKEYVTQKHPVITDSTDRTEVDRLVFCHNDTQYGNMLRLEPPKGSPLLQPQHEHRQLVVIDFEYSGPNPRALDIANHFCEWMYDYTHPTMSHHIWLDRYPNEEEQRRFITSYVEQCNTVFDEQRMDQQIEQLIAEVVDWRPAVSAFWGMWGIVQFPVETDSKLREEYLEKNPQYELSTSPEKPMEIVETEQEDSFDYLSYSREKLGLFWSDCEALNIY